MAGLVDFLGTGIDGIMKGAGDIIDIFATTDEDKLKAATLKGNLALEAKRMQFEAEQAYFKDRESARKMLMEGGGKTQSLLTILFTVGYFGITTFMVAFLLNKVGVEMNNFTVAFISSIFGAFNAIMVQIISFYFGSSKGGEDTGRAVSNSFKIASVKKDDD